MCDKFNNINFKLIILFILSLLFLFIGISVHAAENSFSPYAERHNCASGYYDIEKPNDATYGQVGTSYNITFNYISFYATYNLQPNKYYDIRITFKSNISNNIFNNDYGENLGLSQTHIFVASSMCGNTNGEVTISSYSISGKVLTLRVLVGSTLVDYWQLYTRFTFVGSQGISSTTIEAVDLSGSSGIIENANDNTNSIINNQNDNTQDIIDNQTQNAQDIIDNISDTLDDVASSLSDTLNSSCKTGPLTITKDGFTKIDKKFLSSDGTESNNNSYSISPYIIIKPSTDYKLHFSTTSSNVYWCWYNSSHVVLGCQNYSNTDVTWTAPANSTSIRFSLGGGRIIDINGYVCNDWEKESIDNVNDSINSLHDDINNSDVSSGLIDDFADDLDIYHNDDLTSIVTAPLTLVSSMLSQNVDPLYCQPLQMPFHIKIGSFYDKTSTNTYLPCGSIMWSHANSTLVTGYRILICGFILYHLLIYNYFLLSDMVDPFKDRVETMDL